MGFRGQIAKTALMKDFRLFPPEIALSGMPHDVVMMS